MDAITKTMIQTNVHWDFNNMWATLKSIWKRIMQEPEVDEPTPRINPTGTGRGGMPSLYTQYPNVKNKKE